MKPEAQRIAIAEARGWVWYRIPKSISETKEHRALFHPAIHEYPDQSDIWKIRADGTERICNMEYMEREGYVPKINLDEMYEAENILSGDPKDENSEKSEYAEQLTIVCGGTSEEVWFWDQIHATAAQRAEAFLKTIGKWVEETEAK